MDKLLFPEWKVESSEFLICRTGFPFRENNVSTDDLPQGGAKDYMRKWYDWTQEEYILFFETPCVIEPDQGWAIVGRNNLLYYSLGLSRSTYLRKPDIFKWLRKKVDHLPKAISLRDTGEENYFHFYNDVLSKLFFLVSHNVDVTRTPVIISKKLWDREYFRYYHSKSTLMKSINWTVQDDNYIACDSLIVCKPLTHRNGLWKEIVLPLRPKNAGGNRRVFVSRSRERLRFIENEAEVRELCRRLDFQFIDPGEFSPELQIEIFSSAEIVVGIHGAGLTNIVFCSPGSRVLEIFPPPSAGYLPFHYIMLASMQRLKYTALIGNPGHRKYSGGFNVNIGELENAINSLVFQQHRI